MKKCIILALLSCFLLNVCYGQSSKNEYTNRLRQVAYTNVADIKNGGYLHLATTRTLKEFVIHYAHYSEWHSKKYGGRTVIEKLYTDAAYTYFAGRNDNYFVVEFFKVANRDLEGIDLAALNKGEIERRFVEEIIPEADKQWANMRSKKSKDWDSRFDSFYHYKYDYRVDTKELIIECLWTFNYETWSRAKAKKKTYTAKYNIDTRQFTK